jgi:hypothetical protein
MDYDDRKKLIDELAKQMTGKSSEDNSKGQIIAKVDSSTNTLHFMLSGTKYNIEDMQKAKKHLQEELRRHPEADSEIKVYCEIAIVCIDTVIRQFTEPVDNIINSIHVG